MQTIKPDEETLCRFIIKLRWDMELWVRIIKSGILEPKILIVRFRPKEQDFQALGRLTYVEAKALMPVLERCLYDFEHFVQFQKKK